MFKDGIYSAWFKTPRGEGTGIAHFQDGRISGGDSIMSYSGSYDVAGDWFTATVVTKRHTEGHATVFGIDARGRGEGRDREMHRHRRCSARCDVRGDAHLLSLGAADPGQDGTHDTKVRRHQAAEAAPVAMKAPARGG